MTPRLNDDIATLILLLCDDFSRALDLTTIRDQENTTSTILKTVRSNHSLVINRKPINVSAVCDQFGLYCRNQTRIQNASPTQRFGRSIDHERR